MLQVYCPKVATDFEKLFKNESSVWMTVLQWQNKTDFDDTIRPKIFPVLHNLTKP